MAKYEAKERTVVRVLPGGVRVQDEEGRTHQVKLILLTGNRAAVRKRVRRGDRGEERERKERAKKGKGKGKKGAGKGKRVMNFKPCSSSDSSDSVRKFRFLFKIHWPKGLTKLPLL